MLIQYLLNCVYGDNRTCFTSKTDITGTVGKGRISFVLTRTLVTLNVPNDNLMLPTGHWLHLQSHFADLKTMKVVCV